MTGRYARTAGWTASTAGVWDGDTDPSVAVTYRELYEAVSERRLGHNRRFGELLAAELAAGRESGSLLCVEDVLAAVVVPLARRHPVLLVVVDGMNAAVAAELGEDLERHGWPEILPQGFRHRRGALAAFPSTTEVCRTSLLSGCLRRGGQEEERSGLEELAQRHRLQAMLFHQADLERSAAGEALASPVREAIADPQLRIVAVVLNAVDDALDRGHPGRNWGVEAITHLEALLQAARFASRVVVLVSDHGHVVERRDGELRTQPGAVAARWRPPSEPAGPGEVQLRGRRVLAPEGIVAPWREDLRYARLQAGYHGGASTAEAVVPLLVYSSVELNRWEAASPQAPAWWLGAPLQAPAVSTADEPRQISLFEAAPGGVADLVIAVLASPIYAAQKEKAQRTALEDATVATILRALLDAGGRLGQDALAAVIGVPRYRLGGVIRAAQRHLNVDGYDVISYDADGTTVVLDEALLRDRFDIPA